MAGLVPANQFSMNFSSKLRQVTLKWMVFQLQAGKLSLVQSKISNRLPGGMYWKENIQRPLCLVAALSPTAKTMLSLNFLFQLMNSEIHIIMCLGAGMAPAGCF